MKNKRISDIAIYILLALAVLSFIVCLAFGISSFKLMKNIDDRIGTAQESAIEALYAEMGGKLISFVLSEPRKPVNRVIDYGFTSIPGKTGRDKITMDFTLLNQADSAKIAVYAAPRHVIGTKAGQIAVKADAELKGGNSYRCELNLSNEKFSYTKVTSDDSGEAPISFEIPNPYRVEVYARYNDGRIEKLTIAPIPVTVNAVR